MSGAATAPVYTGQMQQASGQGQFNAVQFQIQQALARLGTAMPVRVLTCSNNGGVSPVGRLTVQPLINMVDGAGNVTPHGTIFDIPYSRLQGGANAVIIDPQPGDVGIAVFSSRDMSSLKANIAAGKALAPTPPGSARRFDMADAMYVGGMLNGTPTQYVAFSPTGINITSPNAVTINAANVTLDSAGNLAVKGEITAGAGGGDSVTLQQHKHGTGTAAAGTSIPTAGT
jgi:hypothetical protein